MRNIYFVIPCYNEQEVLTETSNQLLYKISYLIETEKISDESRIIFVNDGSDDNTWEIIKALHKKNKIFGGINLSRNRGHQNALLAGLMTVKNLCDAVISIDADLQDDINIIDKFIDEFENGCDIVYGVRNLRKLDSFFKRFTAQAFYKFLKFIGVEIIDNHADYRLMSKRAIYALSKFKEVNLFIRGIVPMIGYKTGIVEYERKKRFAGTTKYSLKKMISFAIDGITSLSIKPINFIAFLGFFIFTASIIMLAYFFIMHLLVNEWTSIIISIWAIGGLQILSIGIIGQYIGKIYLETKERPRFIIKEFLK